jgi:hypothetical protein
LSAKGTLGGGVQWEREGKWRIWGRGEKNQSMIYRERQRQRERERSHKETHQIFLIKGKEEGNC